MGQQIKLKYFPQVKDCMAYVSPFGVAETTYPDIYEKPIVASTDTIVNTVVFDALQCLADIYGKNIIDAREPLYTLISGSISKERLVETGLSYDEYYRKIFTSFYSRFSSFQNEVDLEYFYGNKSIPLLQRVITPMLKRVDAKAARVCSKVEKMPTGKVLMISHFKIYIAFRCTIDESLFKPEDGFRIIRNV